MYHSACIVYYLLKNQLIKSSETNKYNIIEKVNVKAYVLVLLQNL